jgi:hypothetical protein
VRSMPPMWATASITSPETCSRASYPQPRTTWCCSPIVCHLFDETHNRVLLRRLRSALRPGGLVAIIDVLTSRDPAEQCSISLYALSLRLRTSSGTVYPIAAYETWTNDAGFGPLQVEPLSVEPSLTLLTSRMA